MISNNFFRIATVLFVLEIMIVYYSTDTFSLFFSGESCCYGLCSDIDIIVLSFAYVALKCNG